eukprot:scaffold189642_cov15-Tisochrysis_lutea.AAC.1
MVHSYVNLRHVLSVAAGLCCQQLGSTINLECATKKLSFAFDMKLEKAWLSYTNDAWALLLAIRLEQRSEIHVLLEFQGSRDEVGFCSCRMGSTVVMCVNNCCCKSLHYPIAQLICWFLKQKAVSGRAGVVRHARQSRRR